jgi:hypothetical protein
MVHVGPYSTITENGSTGLLRSQPYFSPDPNCNQGLRFLQAFLPALDSLDPKPLTPAFLSLSAIFITNDSLLVPVE